MPTTSDNKLDLLYKKFIGIPLSNPSGAAASEAAGSSKSKIIPSLQIFSQSIPSSAPTDLSNVTFTPTNSGGTKQISAGNTHIAKYTQLGLSEVQPQISYRYANPSVSTNLTSPAIPGNYDIAGSTYAITLYGSDGTTVINPSTYPWVFDTDSGYVTFIDPANLLPISLAPPKITFWRYEGTFGLSSSGGSSGAVTGDLSSNGNLFIAYDTSLNSRLVVGSDATVNKRLFILGDASLNGKLFVSGDSSFNGNLYALTQTTSDNSNKVATTEFVKNQNYSTLSYVDSSLNSKVTISYVDNSLNNLRSYTDLSLNQKSSISYVDSSLNSKAANASPIFTGTATIPTADITTLNTIGDSSLNGNVTIGKDLTINGRLNVQNYTNQNIINTTTTNYQLIVSEDLSLNGHLSIVGDASMNGELYVAGNIRSQTLPNSENSTKVATTAFVKNVLDASLGNLSNYYTKSVIDASFNEYYKKTVIDASLSEYYTKSVIDATLEDYYIKSVIDASLGDYYTKSMIDAAFVNFYTTLEEYYYIKTVIDSSLNSKANIDSPTFTGTATIPNANITALNTIEDASLNGNVTIGKDLTINGRLNVKNYTNQNIINTTTTNYQLIVSEDLSLNGRLSVVGDSSMNGELYVAGNIHTQTLPNSENSTKVATTAFVRNVLDASLGNLDNYYTKSVIDASLDNYYNKSFIDASLSDYYNKSVIDASLGNYYTKSVIDASLGNYYTKSVIDASLSEYYTKSVIDASLSNYYNKSVIDACLNNYYSKSVIDASLSEYYTKSDIDASLSEYYTKSVIDSSLNSKASIASPIFSGTAIIPTANITTLNTSGDVSLNGIVVIGKDLTINGRLNVQNYTNQNIINTTTTNYQLIVSEDLSLNGHLSIVGDASMNGNLYVAGTLSATNYADNSIPSSAIIGGVASSSSPGDFTTNGNLFVKYDSSMNGNVVIGKDLTINGRLNVQANTIPANAIIGGVSSSSSPGDFTANGNLTVTGSITGNLNAVSNGNVDSINFWTLTKYMNSLINAPPAVTFGNVDTLSTMIRIPWTYPTQYNIGLTDTLIPVIKNLTVTYSITKSGGATQSGTIINALTTNSYIKSSLTDTTPITGVVLLKSGSTTGYNSNYTFTDGNRNAYVFTDSNIQGLTTGDALTLNVLYTNNNTSTNTASKPSLNFVAAGSPSAPVYRSSNPSTTSVTITIGNPQYGDANNTTTNTTITTYRVNYSSTSNATRYPSVKSSGLQTIDTTVSITPTGTANVSANTTNSITTNIYPETTYTANITAVNNVNSSAGAYSGNFTFTTTPFSIPSTAWSTGLSFGLSTVSSMLFGNNATASSLLLNLSSTYTTSSMTTIINDYERRGVYGVGNSTTITANVVLNGSVTNGPSISVDANIGNTTVPSTTSANSITITPSAIADNYVGNSIGYDGYYKKYTGTVSLASGLFAPSPYQYTVNLSRTSGNVNANTVSSYSFYYDTITSVPGNPFISSFAINTTSYSQVCGIYVINGNSNATFTTSYSVSNLGRYFYKSNPVNYSSSGTIGTIISTNESTIPNGNVYGNLMIYNPVTFNQTITSSSLTNVFTTTIPLTITAYNYNGSASANASAINAIIDGPSVTLITNSISTLYTISNTSSYNGARYYAGSLPDSITSNNNSVSSLFSSVTTAYVHSQSIISGTYGKELQIANGSFVTKASSYGYKDYSSLKYSSSLTNTLNYSGISSSSVYRYACFAWKITAYSGYNYITFTMNNASGFNRSGSSGFQPLTANSPSLGSTTEVPFYFKVEDSANSGGLNTYWIKGNNNTGVQINNNVIGDTAQSASLYNGIPSSGYSTDTSSFKVIFPAPLAGNYNSNTYLYCIIGLPMDASCYFNYMSAQIS